MASIARIRPKHLEPVKYLNTRTLVILGLLQTAKTVPQVCVALRKSFNRDYSVKYSSKRFKLNKFDAKRKFISRLPKLEGTGCYFAHYYFPSYPREKNIPRTISRSTVSAIAKITRSESPLLSKQSHSSSTFFTEKETHHYGVVNNLS